MSREYRIVVNTPAGLRFQDVPTFNANIWCVDYYGRIFKHLDLPTDPYSHTAPEMRSFKHEYKGEDMERIREAIAKPDFKDRLAEALAKTVKEMNYDPKDTANSLMDEVFSLFKNPEAVAVASDYCEEYAIRDD